jgi:hypothetical protein
MRKMMRIARDATVENAVPYLFNADHLFLFVIRHNPTAETESFALLDSLCVERFGA